MVIEVAIHRFLEHDFDAIFLAANALGRSAFNWVERKMISLSHQHSSAILSHDQYGSHLNKVGVTIDDDLKKKISSLLVKHFLKSGLSQSTNLLSSAKIGDAVNGREDHTSASYLILLYHHQSLSHNYRKEDFKFQ